MPSYSIFTNIGPIGYEYLVFFKTSRRADSATEQRVIHKFTLFLHFREIRYTRITHIGTVTASSIMTSMPRGYHGVTCCLFPSSVMRIENILDSGELCRPVPHDDDCKLVIERTMTLRAHSNVMSIPGLGRYERTLTL